MLAEIFLLRIESIIRATGAMPTSSDTRFVPVMLPKPAPKPTDKRS